MTTHLRTYDRQVPETHRFTSKSHDPAMARLTDPAPVSDRSYEQSNESCRGARNGVAKLTDLVHKY